MEILKQLPADVQCMVLHRTSITRQLAPPHRLPVELHCMRSDRHPVALMLVLALGKFLSRRYRVDVALMYLDAMDDFVRWKRSRHKRTVEFNRLYIERSLKSGVDFYVAKGDKEVMYLTDRLDVDEEEYRSWVDYLDDVYLVVDDDEMRPFTERPTGREARELSQRRFYCEYVCLSGSDDIFSEAHSRVSRQCIFQVLISYVYCLDLVVPHIEREVEPAPEGIPMPPDGGLCRP